MSPADGGDIGGARLVGGASSDADAMAARAARMAERLDASAAARRAVNEARREAVQNQASEAESVSGFLSTLNADRAQAEADIQAATTGGRIDELIGTLAALEERVAKAAYFLPNYDVRAAQAALSAARKAADARRTAVAPRKKFAFKKKIHKSSAPIPTQQPAEQSIAADGAADTPLPAIPPGRGEAGGAAGRDVVVTSDGGDYTFAGLRECRVVIRGACTALRLLKCSGCQVFAAPVEGSCFVDACDTCVFHVSTRQIRIHSTKRTDFYLRVLSRPIIEACDAARFAPLEGVDAEGAYAGAAQALAAAGMADATDLWSSVDDFLWIKEVQSPHWSVLPEGERKRATECALAVGVAK